MIASSCRTQNFLSLSYFKKDTHKAPQLVKIFLILILCEMALTEIKYDNKNFWTPQNKWSWGSIFWYTPSDFQSSTKPSFTQSLNWNWSRVGSKRMSLLAFNKPSQFTNYLRMYRALSRFIWPECHGNILQHNSIYKIF